MLPPTVSDEDIAYFSLRFLDMLRNENSLENILHDICEEWFQITTCQSAAFIFINPDTEYLEIKNFKGLSWQKCKDFRRKIDTGYLGELFWQGKQIVLNSVDKDPEIWKELLLEGLPQSLFAVSIENQGQTLGYFYSAFNKEESIDESVLNLATIAASLAGELFTRTYLIRQLLTLEKMDQELKILRYHAFYDLLTDELEKLNRYEKEMSLAIFDVDNFKTIYQTHGRQASLALLKELGAFISSHMRNVDLLGRFGVDEFIMALTQTSLNDAEIFIKRLYEKLNKHSFTDDKIKITLSAGLVSVPTHGRIIGDLIRHAKYALFEAQRLGKNHFYIPKNDEID